MCAGTWKSNEITVPSFWPRLHMSGHVCICFGHVCISFGHACICFALEFQCYCCCSPCALYTVHANGKVKVDGWCHGWIDGLTDHWTDVYFICSLRIYGSSCCLTGGLFFMPSVVHCYRGRPKFLCRSLLWTWFCCQPVEATSSSPARLHAPNSLTLRKGPNHQKCCRSCSQHRTEPPCSAQQIEMEDDW